MVPPLEAAVGSLTLHLPGHAVLLDEGPTDGRLDELGGGDRHSIELTEA